MSFDEKAFREQQERLMAENVKLRSDFEVVHRKYTVLLGEKLEADDEAKAANGLVRDYRNIVELAVVDLTAAVEVDVTSGRVENAIRMLKEALALKPSGTAPEKPVTSADPEAITKTPKDQDACVRELGYAWIYMHYLRPDWLQEGRPGSDGCRKQKKRVKSLMMECAVHWHREDPDFWASFYDRIIDEIENMC